MEARNWLAYQLITDTQRTTIHLILKESFKKKLCSLRQHIGRDGDFYRNFGVSEFIYGVGGYVFIKFADEIVGLNTLQCRKLLCTETGIRLFLSYFTTEKSQNLAKEAGFIDYLDMTYSRIPAKFNIPGTNNAEGSVKLMYTYCHKLQMYFCFFNM